MIRRRYRVPLVSLLLLALMLSACGQSGSGGNTNTNNLTPEATTPAGQSTLPPGATPAGQGSSPQATTTGGAGSPASAATQPPGGTGMIAQLDFGGFGGGDNPQVNYNPFSPNALSYNYTFEPLLALDSFGCKITPWLATDYKWQDPQTLVFTIRDGVKWNDGQPFSADDVVYTFNLLKQQPAFDSQGVWAALDSVNGSGNQVTFKFKQPSVNMLNKVGNGVLIVPKHVWEKESNPVKFTNPDAVGTGPFKPTSFNGQELVLSRVDSYWQADKIHVQKLIFHKNAGETRSSS